jgi:hypothetical protein
LFALLLPARHEAREAGARRAAVEFASNAPLRQLGLASHNYHDTWSYIVTEAANREPASGPEVAAESRRKIVYTASIKLIVEDFSNIGDQVVALVDKFDGYVADSTITGTSGENRAGTWTVRVPVDAFDAFVAAAKELGELVSASTKSQDVSEEYYDVDARIRNKTKEEARLLKLLEDRPGKLADVIAIERELSRCREELERMQGRMRVLADRTALTTVDLDVVEIQNFRPAAAPTFATRVRRAIGASLAKLLWAGQILAIGIVAVAPWFVTLAVLGGGALFVLRPWARRLEMRKTPLG